MSKEKITIEDLGGMVKRGFDEADRRFAGTDEKFEKLIMNMATKDDIKALDERLAGLEERVDKLTDSVDKFIKMMTEYRQEQLAMSERLNRHEEWIKVIANKTGVELGA